jgi:hypothetical protein
MVYGNFDRLGTIAKAIRKEGTEYKLTEQVSEDVGVASG